jgi:hypothetical protein
MQNHKIKLIFIIPYYMICYEDFEERREYY